MIILMGPAGAGKSVQGRLIAKKYGLYWLSVGNILRSCGNESVMSIMEKGMLVNDELVEKYLEEELNKHKNPEKLILDGFPRNLHQVKWLTDYIFKREIKSLRIVQINIDAKTKNERLIKRGRLDDTVSAISKRQKEYEELTIPLIENFKNNRFSIFEVDGVGTIEEVNNRITKALGLSS
ncbi:nucleoside monophosphate kinase [Candidatus Saccharibacteria bacterium CPR2]|nr:nucleoside monophosphate kinase [Candidatus Saccharibacteria bacterium CPR2]